MEKVQSGDTAKPRLLLLVMGIAAVLRLSIFVPNLLHPARFFSPDSTGYITAATHFHQTYFAPTSPLSELGLLRTPGYPALIHVLYAIAGDRPWVVILVQIAMGVGAVGLVYVLARRLFGPVAALCAALALALDPISIILANYLQPEVMFTLLLVAGSLLWVRSVQERSWRWAALAGVVFGLAVLVRPVGLYLPVILIPATLFLWGDVWRKRLASALVLVTAFAVPVGAWIGHNAEATGAPVLSTVESINLLYYRAAGALSQDEGISVAEARARLSRELARRVGPDMTAAQRSRVAGLLAFQSAGALAHAEGISTEEARSRISRELARRIGAHQNAARRSLTAASLALGTLFRHPVGAFVTWASGAFRMLAGPGRDELLRVVGVSGQTGLLGITLEALEVLVYALILAGAVWGCRVLLRDRRRVELVLVLAFILYFLVASSGLEAYSRFRVPLMPLFALLAGCGYQAVASRVRRSPKALLVRSEYGLEAREPVPDIRSTR